MSTSPSKGTRDLDTVAANLPRHNRLKRSKVGFRESNRDKRKREKDSKAWRLEAQIVCESGLNSTGMSATNQVCGQGQSP